MKHLVASIFILLATSSTALATATITCQSDAGASVHLQAFIGPELVVTGAEIVSQGTHWSTYNVDAEQITILQVFSGPESVKVDLSDVNAERIVAKIRLFAADEGMDVAIAGTLHMPGVGVYALICEGP